MPRGFHARRNQSPSEIPMELISLGFTALYFRGGRALFTTRPSRCINHKSISQNRSFRFVSPFPNCLSLSLRPPTLSVASLSQHVTREMPNARNVRRENAAEVNGKARIRSFINRSFRGLSFLFLSPLARYKCIH